MSNTSNHSLRKRQQLLLGVLTVKEREGVILKAEQPES